MTRWLTVFVIGVAALVLAGTMLQAMNVINFGQMALSGLESVSAFQEPIRTYRQGLHAQLIISEERDRTERMEADLSELRKEIEAEWHRLEQFEVQLHRREAELNQKSRQLDAREESLKLQTKNLHELERLQEIYTAMKPRDLAPILEELDDSIVAIVLAGMRERQVAAVLAEIDPTRAARLSKMVGGISSK